MSSSKLTYAAVLTRSRRAALSSQPTTAAGKGAPASSVAAIAAVGVAPKGGIQKQQGKATKVAITTAKTTKTPVTETVVTATNEATAGAVGKEADMVTAAATTVDASTKVSTDEHQQPLPRRRVRRRRRYRAAGGTRARRSLHRRPVDSRRANREKTRSTSSLQSRAFQSRRQARVRQHRCGRACWRAHSRPGF